MRILSYSSEYLDVPMRHNEDNMNEALSKLCPLKCDMKRLD
jgi:activating signal cointegrator complex subunit 3